FHAYMADCVLLLPALALIVGGSESRSLVRLTTLAALPFPYVLLCAGPPYSAAFDLLLIAVLLIAVREARARSSASSVSPVAEPAVASAALSMPETRASENRRASHAVGR